MPANPWELRADVRPLDAAAARWSEVGERMARHGDEIIDAARRATEGWESAAAESYDRHRRQLLENLDRFTALTAEVASSLRAISSVLTSSQKELDQAWATVAMVPHESVGESRYLVFHPGEDDERGKVDTGRRQTEEIRGRLTLSLDQESARLRRARAELSTVHTELKTLVGGSFPGLYGPGGEVSGVGMVPPLSSTSVPGSPQSGVAALPPLAAPMAVSMPHLGGISAAALAPIASAALGGAAGRRGVQRSSAAGVPPMGGMGAGGMAARAGTTSRGMASGRSGPARIAKPRLDPTPAEEAAARAARDKDAVKEAKRAAIEEKRAERAARRAEREAAREERRSPVKVRISDDDDPDERDDLDDLETDDDVEDDEEGVRPATGAETDAGPGERRR